EAHVKYLPSKASLDKIKDAVIATGFEVRDIPATHDHHSPKAEEFEHLRRRFIAALILTLPVAIISMFDLLEQYPWRNWMLLALTCPVLGWCGAPFFAGAFKS